MPGAVMFADLVQQTTVSRVEFSIEDLGFQAGDIFSDHGAFRQPG